MNIGVISEIVIQINAINRFLSFNSEKKDHIFNHFSDIGRSNLNQNLKFDQFRPFIFKN